MRFRIPSLITALALAALSPVAGAAPYWVTWEGDDYPENEGWERRHYLPHATADRTLADGVMTLDGMASVEIADMYRMERPLNPAPGEEFVVQWRLRVNQVGNRPDSRDPGVAIRGDDGWHVVLIYGVDEIASLLESTVNTFSPDVFHSWELRSPDMRSYTLLLNGEIYHSGHFTQSGAIFSRVSWGDLVAGSVSNADWDYFRFGVVPEPAACTSLLVLLGVARAFQLTRRGL